eukprot:1866188-Prymnesium_polylepis.1
MGALHNMRARAASSPTRPGGLGVLYDVFLDRLHDFVGVWAVGTGHFPYGGAWFEEFTLFSFDVVP